MMNGMELENTKILQLLVDSLDVKNAGNRDGVNIYMP